MARASDADSGIFSVSLDAPSESLILASNFLPGGAVVDFNISVSNGSTDASFKDVVVVKYSR